MQFISYAQNFEDVMLWRAFKNINSGFYIDIGANHPVIDSVTNAFYERGWSGINVEPLEQHIIELNQDRPRDINLQVAVSNYIGTANLIVPNLRGLATLAENMIEKYQKEKYQSQTLEVSVHTLDSIWQNYVNEQTVHFLKIDVESHEKQVLEGFSLDKYRPWIIIIESTLPNSQVENYQEWESMLIKNKYQMIYFDGLNRYYCAQEQSELAQYFKVPPNVFDEFIRYREYDAVNLLLQIKQNLSDW